MRKADRDVIRFRPLALLGAAIIIAILFFAREVFIPLSLAILLSFLLAIPCTFLERHGFKRGVAVSLLVVLSCGGMVAIGWAVTAQFYELAGKLPDYQETIEAKLASLKTSPRSNLGRMNQMVRRTVEELQSPDSKNPDGKTTGNPAFEKPKPAPIPVEVHQPDRGSFEVLKGIAAPLLKPLATGVMVLVVLIFMLLGREDVRNRVIRLAGTDRMDLTTDALDEAAHRVSRYLLMQLIVNCCFGLFVGTGLYFIGVPSPALWGALATLLRFIPYVGCWVAAAGPLLLAFAVQPGWGKLAWTGGLFLVSELATGNIIEPLLYGSSTGVSPIALVLAAIFWTWLWGPIGLLLSTPLTVCLAVIGLHVPQLRFLHVLLGDEPVLTPETHFYQRMLAMDRHEADGLALSFLKDKTLADVYEQLMIPSLTFAKEDLDRGRLTQDRETFVLENVGRLVDELAEDEEERIDRNGKEQDHAPCRLIQAESVIAVVPANYRADEIAGSMFARVLAHRGATVRILSANGLKDLDLEKIKLVCISSVPPTGLRRARAVCKQLRARFPHLKLIIGLWGAAANSESEQALTAFKPDCVATSFDEAIRAVESMSAVAT